MYVCVLFGVCFLHVVSQKRLLIAECGKSGIKHAWFKYSGEIKNQTNPGIKKRLWLCTIDVANVATVGWWRESK